MLGLLRSLAGARAGAWPPRRSALVARRGPRTGDASVRRQSFGAAGDRLDAEGLVAYLTVAGTVPEALMQWLDGRGSDASLLEALAQVPEAGAAGWRVLDLSSAAEASPHWSSDRVLADWRQLQPRIWRVARESGFRGALLVGAEQGVVAGAGQVQVGEVVHAVGGTGRAGMVGPRP